MSDKKTNKNNQDKQDPRKGSIKFKEKRNGRKGRGNSGKNSDTQWQRGGRTAVVWLLFIVGMLFFYQLMNSLQLEGEQEIKYDPYREFLENGKIESAEIVEREFHGELFNEEPVVLDNGTTVMAKNFKVILPPFYPAMEDEWRENNVRYTFGQKEIEWSMIMMQTLPWIIIILIWVYFFRRMQGGGARGIFSFGKSKAKLLIENKPKITFDDVAGADEAKVELQEIIEFLKLPERFQKLGGKIPKGALLVGPPGTGKTLLARAVAGEAGVPFFSISGADFVEMFVGVGASRVRDLFEQGKKNAPCIIFIDEIDAVGRSRGAGLGGGHDEREQTLNQLLVEMDGFEDNEGVILIAATNRPDVLDTALMRPGRFDRQIIVDRPDLLGREGILKVHTKKTPLDSKVKLDILAKGTPGLSGADLANIVNEAALLAARNNNKSLTMEDFEQAKDKVMMGAERKTLLISEEEKKSTAYHEAGHVLTAMFTPGSDPIHKVTIIPRGRALGVTTSLPIDERHTYSKNYCEALLVKMMGGRAAERIVFNTLTTGAGNDIEQATALSRKMVCEWGMSERLGPLTFGKKDEEVFLGRDFGSQKNYSDQTAHIIDEEIKTIVTTAEVYAVKLLKKNIDILHKLADELLNHEILDSNQIKAVVNGKSIKPKSRSRKKQAPAKDKDDDFKSAAHKKDRRTYTRKKKTSDPGPKQSVESS